MRTHRHALIAAIAATGLFAAGCSDAEEPEQNEAQTTEGEASTVTVTDNEDEKTIEVPPERVGAFDNRTFALLEALDVDLVVAAQDLISDELDYANDDSILNTGNHREPDLEKIVEADPTLIISGQRYTQYDEDMKELAPDAEVLNFEPRDGEVFSEELIRQAEALGEVFQKEDEVAEIVSDFTEALDRAKEAYDGETTVLATIVSGGTVQYVAPGDGRTFGWIFDELGLEPALELEIDESDSHGDEISVETIAQGDPDVILALDRDAAVASDDEEVVPAEELLENNEALKGVTAVENGDIIYAPKDTYINESILAFTEILNQIADAFENLGENGGEENAEN